MNNQRRNRLNRYQGFAIIIRCHVIIATADKVELARVINAKLVTADNAELADTNNVKLIAADTKCCHPLLSW